MNLPEPYYDHAGITIYHGDCREVLASLPEQSARCCVTSPPYWGLRDYNVDGQIGLEVTPEEFVGQIVGVFREVRRVLADDGTLWLNLGDSYCGTSGGSDGKHAGLHRHRIGGRTKTKRGPGLKPKDLVGIPWRVALALQADGWYLRSDIIWHKPSPMPESTLDRPTRAHEYIFLLSKSPQYHFDIDAVRTPLKAKTLTTFGFKRKSLGSDASGLVKADRYSRTVPVRRPRVNGNGEHAGAAPRTVWTIAPKPFAPAHFATFPPELAKRCVLAGAAAGDTVLDPFMGAGTTAMVARELGCKSVGVELNPEYCELAAQRLAQGVLPFHEEAPR